MATLSRWLRQPDERTDWVTLLQKPLVRVASQPTRLPVLAMALAPLAVGPPTTVTETATAASAALSLRQVLALAAPRYGAIVMPTVDVTPYALATRRAREPLPIPLAALEAAAERVEELARTAPPELPNRDRSIEPALEAHAVALQRPAEALRHTAWALWYEASAERWWRGDPGGARRALARSVAVAPERMELFTAALALLVGEPAVALAQAERSRKDDGATALLVDVQRTLALAALGRFDDALAAAAAADERARHSSETDLATPGSLLRNGVVTDPRVRRADAAWLHAAMAVLAARALQPAGSADDGNRVVERQGRFHLRVSLEARLYRRGIACPGGRVGAETSAGRRRCRRGAVRRSRRRGKRGCSGDLAGCPDVVVSAAERSRRDLGAGRGRAVARGPSSRAHVGQERPATGAAGHGDRTAALAKLAGL